MVSLHLYDTAARALREFHPQHEGRASLYVCGATVQAVPHVGHVRSGVDFDVLRRWLAHGGLDVHARPQRHRHRRQDPQQGGRGGPSVVGVGRHARAGVHRRLRRPGLPPAVGGAPGHRPRHRDGRADRAADRGGPRLPVRLRLGRRLLRRRRPGRTTARSPGSAPDEVEQGEAVVARQARPPRLHAVEGGQARRAELAHAVGSRASRLAPGVLGDGDALPRPDVRHPRRRARPGVPAPRERAGAVERGGRRLRRLLAAQRLGDDVRGEDVEVARATP